MHHAILVVDAGRDGQLRGRLPGERSAHHQRVGAIGVRVCGRAGKIVHPIDVAAIMAPPATHPETELVVDDGAADRHAAFVAGRAVFGRGDFTLGVHAVIGEAWLRGDVANRTAFGAGAEQRALRTTQHLHAFEVEYRRQGIVGAEAERAKLDRRVVDVDAGGGVARGGIDPADGNVVAVGVEGHAGGEADELAEVLDVQLLHALAGERADALRHLAQHLGAALCGHDDLLHPGGWLRGLCHCGCCYIEARGGRQREYETEFAHEYPLLRTCWWVAARASRMPRPSQTASNSSTARRA